MDKVIEGISALFFIFFTLSGGVTKVDEQRPN